MISLLSLRLLRSSQVFVTCCCTRRSVGLCNVNNLQSICRYHAQEVATFSGFSYLLQKEDTRREKAKYKNEMEDVSLHIRSFVWSPSSSSSCVSSLLVFSSLLLLLLGINRRRRHVDRGTTVLTLTHRPPQDCLFSGFLLGIDSPSFQRFIKLYIFLIYFLHSQL